MNRGIVIGKFYPPHLGHRYLIETALAQADEVTAIVCDKEGQKIRGAIRAGWLKEMAPRIKTVVVPDIYPADDSKAWAEYTIRSLGYVPEVVFTSESYGTAYAHFMGSRHVLVDQERGKVPISSTEIRSNPYHHWDFLAPCVRAYFAKRICIVGSESSGTTTLAMALAEHYQTIWVPEFGRLYTEAKLKASGGLNWQTEDFIFIAQQQNELEDQLARSCNKVLICDTDAFATSLWHERYLGFMSNEVDALSRMREYDLYILTDVGIPFVQDGTRDGKAIRENMHRRFEEELNLRNKRFVVLKGDPEIRLEKAKELCDNILKQNPDL